MNWETHNKFVELADDELRGKSHGNFVPALKLIKDILAESTDANCALLVEGQVIILKTTLLTISNREQTVMKTIC
jgi:hypothetical protein